MKKNIRLFACAMALLFLQCIPQPASANTPPPAPWYSFYMENCPEEAVYADLLIFLPESDPEYTELVTGNVPESFAENAQILSYCEDDYRSYTFHYRGAKSRIRLDEENCVVFFTDGSHIFEESVAYEHKEEIEGRGKIRIALLDGQGNILLVSQSHSLKPKGLFSYSLGSFYYDAALDEMQVSSESNALAVLIFCIAGILGIALNCFVEWMVALAFEGVKRYSALVVRVNLVSQILMRLTQIGMLRVMIALKAVFPYLVSVAVLEVVVYLCECWIYRKKMQGVSRRRCIGFTICANTASLAAGLLLLGVVL